MPAGVSIGQVLGKIVLMDDFSKPLEIAAQKLEMTGKKFEQVGSQMQSAGAKLTAGLTLPIAGVGIAAIKAATDFNKSMANVATLIPGNTERVKELKRSVQDMAIATGTSTADLTAGLYQTVSAFGDTSDTARILEINAKAAAAGMATTTEAINLTSAVTKAYGDTSAEAVSKASDLAFTTVRLGQTTFPELAAAIGKVAPITAQLKISQEELNAVFATNTGVIGQASEVSTALRASLVGLQNPSDAMSATLAQMGFNTGEAALETLGYKGTLDALLQQTGGNTNELIKLWDATESWAGIASIAGAQSGAFDEKLLEMKDSLDATGEAFREQTEGINASGFAWAQLKQQVIVAAQNLGDVLLPIVMRAGESLRPLLDMVLRGAEWFGKLPVPVQTAGVMLAGLAAAAGPVLIVMGSLVTAAGTVTGAFGRMTASVVANTAAHAANNAVLTVSASRLGPLVHLLPDVMTKTLQGRNAMGKFTAGVKKFDTAFITAPGRLSRFSGVLGSMGKSILKIVPLLGKGLAVALRAGLKFLIGPVGWVVSIGLLVAKFEPFRNLVGAVGRALLALAKEGIAKVVEGFRVLLDQISPVTDQISSWIGKLKEWGAAVADFVGAPLQRAADDIDGFTQGVSGNMVAALRQGNEALERLAASGEEAGFGLEISGGAIQRVALSGDKMETAVIRANQQLEAMAQAGEKVAFRYKEVEGVLRKVDAATGKLIPTAEEATEVLKGFVTAEDAAKQINELRIATADGRVPAEQLAAQWVSLRDQLRNAGLETPELVAALDSLKPPLVDAEKEAKALAEALSGFTLAEDVAKDIDKLRLAVESAEVPTVQLEAAWKDLVAKMQEAGWEIPASMSAIADSLNIVERSFERAREEQEKRWDTANLEALNDGFDQLQTELLEAEKAALQAGEALKNFDIQPPDRSTIPQIDAVTEAAERLGLKAVNVAELNKSFVDLQAVVAAGGFAPSDLKRIYDDLYRTFQQLGPLTDEQAAAFERLRGQIEQQPNLSFFGKIGDSLKSVFGELAELGSVFTNALGTLFTDGLSGALGALQTGLSQLLSKAFNSVIPGLGTLAAPLISAIENLLSGMFGKAHAADHVAEQFGIALSDGLAKAIDDLAASQFQGNFDAAFRSMMAQAIQEASITTEAELSKWVTLTHQILSSVDEGFMSLQQAVESMSDSWLALVPAMEATGASAMGLQAQISDLISRGVDLDTLATQLQPVISAMFDSGISGAQELVDWLNTMGVEIDGVATSAEAAVAAIEAAFGAGDFSAMSTAIRDAIAAGVDLSSLEGLFTDVMAQYKDLVLGASQEVVAGVEALFATVRREVEVLAEDGTTQTIEQLRLTKREAEFAASALLVTFEQMRAAGVPLTEIFEAMGDQITQLADNFKGALPPVLAEVDALFSAMQGSAAKAIEKVDAIGGSIGALGEMGLLSAGQLDFFGDKIDRAYAKLIEGGAGSEQAMALLGPQLRQLIDLSEQYGFKIDRNTRALIDQADASGLLPPAIEPVEDIFGDIRSVIILLAESLGVQVPAAIKQAADAAQEAENRIKSPFKRAFMEMAADAGWAAREARGVWKQLSPDLRRVFEEGGEVGRAQFKQIAMAAGLSAADVRQLWKDSGGDLTAIFGQTTQDARREAREQTREARLQQRQQVLDAREVELAKRKVLRETMRLAKGWVRGLGDEWRQVLDGMLGQADQFKSDLVGNSIIPDMVSASVRQFDKLQEGFGGSLSDMTKLAAGAELSPSIDTSRYLGPPTSPSNAASVSAPLIGAAPPAPAPSRRPDETLLRELLHELRALRQDQRTFLPDALRNANRHGKQTSS